MSYVYDLIGNEDLKSAQFVYTKGATDDEVKRRVVPVQGSKLDVAVWRYPDLVGSFVSKEKNGQLRQFELSKEFISLIRPPSTPGVAVYDIEYMISAIQRIMPVRAKRDSANDEKISRELKKAKPSIDLAAWKADQSRFIAERNTRIQQLNRYLIMLFQFNRFDASIKHWTEYYNSYPKTRGIVGTDALSPDVVKSLLYEETKLGIGGDNTVRPDQYDWDDPSSTPYSGRFNLGQTMTSGASVNLLMICESVENDAVKLVKDHKLLKLSELHQKKPLKEAELWAWENGALWTAALAYLKAADTSIFVPPYARLRPGVATARVFSYDFHIRSAIRWIFAKYEYLTQLIKSKPKVWNSTVAKEGGMWKTTIRIYAGEGETAIAYRNAIYARVSRGGGRNLVLQESDLK